MDVTKTGYVVKSYTGYTTKTEIYINKVDIVGGPMTTSGVEHWLIANYTALWSTDHTSMSKINSVKCPTVPYSLPIWETNIFLSMDEAKKHIEYLIETRKIRHQKDIKGIHDDIARLDKIDLNSLPKDSYVSPFSGKKN